MPVLRLGSRDVLMQGFEYLNQIGFTPVLRLGSRDRTLKFTCQDECPFGGLVTETAG